MLKVVDESFAKEAHKPFGEVLMETIKEMGVDEWQDGTFILLVDNNDFGHIMSNADNLNEILGRLAIATTRVTIAEIKGE